MDETKQPGLLITAVIVTESHFRRSEFVPPDVKYDSKLEVGFNYDAGEQRLGLQLVVTVQGTNQTVDLGVTYYCEIRKDPAFPNMTFSEYVNNGGPQGLIYGFAREHIISTTMKGGVPLCVLNPFNTKPENKVVID
jgi:hypothetical protein